MDFDFPSDIDPVVVAGNPEASFATIGLSLLLPYLEPDPKLVDDLERFNKQEGQHYRQHMLLNDAIRLQGFDQLAELEAKLDADYRRFSKTRSLRFNLAYAEGFEALTTAFARFSFERGADPNTHPSVTALFQWHLVEELEHRTVAFDVYDYLYGDYFYRLIAGLYAQWHMSSFIRRVASSMLAAVPDVVEQCGGAAGRKARARAEAPGLRKSLLPKLLQTYSPRYTPHDIPFEDELQQMAEELNQLARVTS